MKSSARLTCLAAFVVFLAACDGKSEAQLLAEAKGLLAKRDYATALIQIKNALEKDPNSPTARLFLGETLLEHGDPAAALIELLKAEEAQAPQDLVVPPLARALLATGETAKVNARFKDLKLQSPAAGADLKATVAAALATQGDLAGARDATDQSLRLQPGNAAAVMVLARLAAADGDSAQALRLLDELLTREPGNEKAGLLKGEILSLAKLDPEAAIAAYREVTRANAASVPALSAIVNALLQQGKLAEARTAFEALKKVAPTHGDTQLMQAQLAFEDKDYKTAREIAERLLTARPNNLRLLQLAAAAEFSMQRYTLAEGLLGRALKVAPEHLPARLLLAQTYLRADQPEKAIEALQPVLDSAQAEAASQSLAGDAFLRMGDNKRAEAAYKRAAKAAPEDVRIRTSLAMVRLASGDSASASAQLEALTKGDPSAHADQALVNLRVLQGDLKGALKAADALVQKQPDAAAAWVLRGQIQARLNDRVGAATSFETALTKDRTHFPAVAGLVSLDLLSGRPDQARQRLDALVRSQPKNAQARLALAEMDTQLGAADGKVIAQLREAIKVDASQPASHLALIERLLANADGQAALAAAQEAAAALPQSPEILEALGRTQMASGDYQRGVSTFKQLAALRPRSTLPLVRLAEAHVALKDFAPAEAALKQALALEPDSPLVLRGQARLAVASGQAARAVQIARAFQGSNPKDHFGFALEGEIAVMTQDWPAAATAYGAALQRSKLPEHAIKRHQGLRMAGKPAEADRMAADWLAANPKDAQFHFYLGDVLVRAKDWAKAETEYRAVLALRPQHASAMNNVAWLMATQRKPGAVAMAEKASALLPDRAEYLDTLAFALESEQEVGKAVDVQKRALELNPKDAGLRWRLAQLLIKNGDKAAARKELETLSGLGTRFDGQAEVATLLKTL